MAETPTTVDDFPCFFVGCDNSTASCTYTCYTAVHPSPFPPPPPPPPPPSSSHSHIAPFLIATVSILGISFLLLSTCTIILRLRFTRRRRGGVSPESSDDVNGEGDDGQSFVDHPIWHITTVGLQQSVIDSITAFKYKKIDGFFIDGSDSSCSVCLTEFEEGDDLRLLPKCSHAFHVSCIDTWLRSHKTCPLCRAPIVNEIPQGGAGQLNPTDSDSGDVVLRVNMDDLNRGEGSSHQLREMGDNLGELPMLEGVKIAEIPRKNRELRILSDLGDNHRFRGLEEGLEPVRRSISFNAIAASAICGAVVGNEGSSSDGSFRHGGNRVEDVKKTELGKGCSNKRALSMSGSLIKSSSIGRSLQKGPVSMKRSLSSSSKFFSFRRTRSQASILPL